MLFTLQAILSERITEATSWFGRLTSKCNKWGVYHETASWQSVEESNIFTAGDYKQGRIRMEMRYNQSRLTAAATK